MYQPLIIDLNLDGQLKKLIDIPKLAQLQRDGGR